MCRLSCDLFIKLKGFPCESASHKLQQIFRKMLNNLVSLAIFEQLIVQLDKLLENNSLDIELRVIFAASENSLLRYQNFNVLLNKLKIISELINILKLNFLNECTEYLQVFAVVAPLYKSHEVLQCLLWFISFGDVIKHIPRKCLACVVECAITIQYPCAG